jgi:conjugal transfer pilus assembly protein TraW
VRSHYSKLALILSVASFGANAGTSSADEAWLEESRKLVEEASEAPAPDWLPTKADPKILESLKPLLEESKQIKKTALLDEAKKSGLISEEEMAEKAAKGDGLAPSGTVYLFISFSMPELDIKAVLEEASSTGAVVVLKGVKKELNIQQTSILLAKLTQAVTPRPNVIIDPRPYLKYGIDAAPAITLVREGQPALHARGIYSVDWIKGKKDSATENDLGVWGATYPIEEIDIIDEMKSRVAKVDWEKKKKAAYENYWQKKTFLDIPYAMEDQEYEIDPTIRISKDIIGTNGEILAYEGQSINPLDVLPFTKTLFIFDATNEKHLNYVQAETEKLKAESKSYILMTTKIDGDLGWKAFGDVENLFKRPVYLLNKEIKGRFQIDRIPSVVSAKGRVFIIKEKRL